MVLRHVLTVEADKNVTAVRAAEIADIFEGNLLTDSTLRYQIEHLELDSARQDKNRKTEGRKCQDGSSDKSDDKINLSPKQDKENSTLNDSGKGEKKKKDFSKLPHFGKKGVCRLCDESRNNNNGCRSPFHKKPVTANLCAAETIVSGDGLLCQNPTVCPVAAYDHHHITERLTERQWSRVSRVMGLRCLLMVLTLKYICDNAHVDSSESHMTEFIQTAELIDAYHPSDETHSKEMFDDLSYTFLSNFESMNSDSYSIR